MTKRFASVLVLVAACGGDSTNPASEQAALEIGHGAWEITIRAFVGELASPDFTIKTCVSFENPAPGFELTPEGVTCNGRSALSGQTLEWNQDCDTGDKHWDTDGTLTYVGDTFTGNLTNKENGVEFSTAVISGVRIGDC